MNRSRRWGLVFMIGSTSLMQSYFWWIALPAGGLFVFGARKFLSEDRS